MNEHKRGFTLIELLVVIAIISLLSSIVMASLNTARAKARDARRLSDMHQMQIALDMYYNSFGRYPYADDDAECGGWDSTKDGTFIIPLVENGFLPSHILDPTLSDTCNYKYATYGAGSYNCDASKGNFYVLGVPDMETSSRPHPSSPGWSCPNRNYQGEFDWVTGSYEN